MCLSTQKQMRYEIWKIIIYECKILFEILEWDGGFPGINLTKGFVNSMQSIISANTNKSGIILGAKLELG